MVKDKKMVKYGTCINIATLDHSDIYMWSVGGQRGLRWVTLFYGNQYGASLRFHFYSDFFMLSTVRSDVLEIK